MPNQIRLGGTAITGSTDWELALRLMGLGKAAWCQAPNTVRDFSAYSETLGFARKRRYSLHHFELDKFRSSPYNVITFNLVGLAQMDFLQWTPAK